QTAVFSRAPGLERHGLPVYISTCAEHGARVGRSRVGRPYAQAEGQPARGTKAQPARGIFFVQALRASSTNRLPARVKTENVQIACFPFFALLKRLCGPRSVPLAPSTERE